MPLPALWNQIPIVGQFRYGNGYAVAGGRIEFVMLQTLSVGGVLVQAGKYSVVLDGQGNVPAGFTLPATNDPDLSVAGWAYIVSEKWPGGRPAFKMFVPYDAVSIDLATVGPAIYPGELLSIEEAALASSLGLLATATVEATAATELAAATSAFEAASSAVSASGYAAAASNSANAAAAATGGIYVDTTVGLAATASGQYFSVPSADTAEYLILYKNNAGTPLLVKTYPSVNGINMAVESAVNASAVNALSAATSASLAESASGPTYASQAAGEAATTAGQSFAVDNGDGTVTVRLRTSAGSTTQRTLATTMALALSTGAGLVGFKARGSASVVRTLEERLQDGDVSVLDFIPVAQHAAILDRTSTFDCQPYIQAAIDYAIYIARKRVHAPGGLYNIGKTLHLGYGIGGYSAVVFEGDGYSYNANENFSGTGIMCNFSNGPAFNIQGARGSVIRALSVQGKNDAWLRANRNGSYYETAGYEPLLDDTLVANWFDPTLDPRASSRYAPYAAFTVDGYSGPRPATSYPDIAYPAEYTGTGVAQYGKTTSSDVLIEDVQVNGFVCVLANQPSDEDSNADFTALRRVNAERCVYGVSVGNTQSRNMSLIDVKMAAMHTILVGNKHGRQNGKFNGTISGLSVGACIQLFDLPSSSVAGPITFVNCYSEAMWRLGDIAAATAVETGITFQSCVWALNGQNNSRGIPATVMGGAGNQLMDIRFCGGSYLHLPSIAVFNQSGVIFDGAAIFSTERENGPIPEYIAVAANALGGGLVMPRLDRIKGQRLHFRPINLDNGSVESLARADDACVMSDRRYCIPHYSFGAVILSDINRAEVRRPYVARAVDKASLSSVSLVGRTLTFDYPVGTVEAALARFGGDVGDVLWDELSHTVFFIKSRVGLTVTAIAQNNYKSNGAGGFNLIDAMALTTGYFYKMNCRLYTPAYFLRGDLTQNSAIVTNAGRADGSSGWYDSQIAVGDYVFVEAESDSFFGEAAAKVTARSHAAGTITFVGGASYTQARKQLPIWVRKPPANT